jgi:predicted ATP-binding protein involved in virulence
MQLLKSNFDNFRSFKNYPLDYGSETTVIIGKNGSGKSSILSAIRRGLSFMFAKPKDYRRNLATSNNAIVRSFEANEANFDPVNRVYNYPIKSSFEGIFNDRGITWSMVKSTENGGYQTSSYKDALNEILSYYNNDLLAPLPVLAVITDSFPHELINFGAKVRKTVSQDILPRDLGYYGWDERTNCIELWLNRFYKASNYEKDLQDDIRSLEGQLGILRSRITDAEENNEALLNHLHAEMSKLYERLKFLQNNERGSLFHKERLYIENKLFEFAKPIQQEYSFINQEFELYRISVNRPDKKNYILEFSFKDGREISFDKLPMGYKRVFSMVIDIAYRSYILNEDRESKGIVLIDELELHLHPTLQQDILQRLRRTFPKIQFIITTHSPLVISNFKVNDKNKTIKLEQEGTNYSIEYVQNVYGLEYSTNLNEVMEVAPRPSTIDKYINAYLFLKGKGKTKQADEMYKKLKDYVGGTIPEMMKDEINEKKKAYDK